MGWLVSFFGFFGWFQVLSQMVPISLIVTAELVKVGMSKIIAQDIKMYDHATKKTCVINRSTIHEDLGVVDIIFSDKTGTLTQNKMGIRYFELDLPSKSTHVKYGSTNTTMYRMIMERKKNDAEKVKWTKLLENLENKDEATEEFSHDQQNRVTAAINSEDNERITRFLQHMVLSNTVKSYVEKGELKYQSESAEELAMLEFARLIGYTKEGQEPTTIKKQFKNEVAATEEKFKLLACFGFTSRRARVTMVYQDVKRPDIVHIMTKGQGSVILPLLKD